VTVSIDGMMGLSRLLLSTSTLVLFGSSLFFNYGLSAATTTAFDPPHHRARRLLLAAAATALLATVLWLMAEAALLTGNPRDALRWSPLASVLMDTRFGRIGALRALILSIALALLLALPEPARRLWRIQAGLGAAALASLAWTGHGSMDDGAAGRLHLAGDVLHLLGAGVWIGALVPLALMLLSAPASGTAPQTHQFALALGRFSRLGAGVVALLAATGILNSWFLIRPASWRVIGSTTYGRLLLVKIALFALMLLLAALNRFWWAPRLNALLADPRAAPGTLPVQLTLRALRAILVTETLLALVILAVVARLGTLEPPGLG
jgi:putative copper resistance protein D